jgi:ceramide glucosyltransferase
MAAAAAGGVAYLAVALWRVRSFQPRPERRGGFTPAITVLKPLHGWEKNLEENLATFCDQDYPEFQVIFCATDPHDAAIVAARRVVERFPQVDAEIVVRGAAALPNPKIANAANGFERAKHGLIAIVDADMRVDRDYLRAIAAPFEDGAVGAVTCLYAGVAAQGIVSTLSAMFVNEHFMPSVLVAGAVEPLQYCFGSTMAVRREVLIEIGGFAALGGTIADDHRLGALVAEAGRRVVLAPYVVENVQAEEAFDTLWQREVRWARTIRSVRPLGSTLAVITYGLPLALIAWMLRPRSGRRVALLVAASLLRLALHRAARRSFAPRSPLQSHLVPVRDLLALAVWAVGRWGSSVRWHEEDITL